MNNYERLVEEGNQRDGLVRSDRSISHSFHVVRIEISRVSKLRLRIDDMLVEIRWQQIRTLLRQDAKQLLKGFERFSLFEGSQRLSLGDQVPDIVLDVCEQRSKVVGVIPAPTSQIVEIVLIDKLEAIDVVGENVPEIAHLAVDVDLKVARIVVGFSRQILVHIHLFQSLQSLLFVPDFGHKHFLQLILEVLLLFVQQLLKLKLFVCEKGRFKLSDLT